MGIISGFLKYKAVKKGMKAVKEVFSSKSSMPAKRSSVKRKPALRKATVRA